MQPWRLSSLPDYAFPRMRALLKGIAPGGIEEINLSIGEPKHPFPDFISDILVKTAKSYSSYPPNNGTPEFRSAVHHWLNRRFSLAPSFIDNEKQILPLSGTREGLFNAALAILPQQTEAHKSLVLIPNPFYQCYAAAALAAGADLAFLPATKETNFLPAFSGLNEETLTRTDLVYLCAPANPQGSIASFEYWTELLRLAQKHDFVIVADECYCEIYDKEKPTGILQAVKALAAENNSHDIFNHVLSFHSLSKRSNLPGLRSGFVTGGPELMERFARLRSYGGAPSPLPVLAAASAAWADEAHVEVNRATYRTKFDLTENIFGERLGFYRPPGGFFLWLDVSTVGLNSEEATIKLWREGGIKVLPGCYLARESTPGDPLSNPGHSYIRIALVHDLDITEKALTSVNQILS